MKSNYPRSDADKTDQKPKILLRGLALAVAIHAFFAYSMPAHPASSWAKQLPTDSRVVLAVLLWTFSSITAIILTWRSSEWKAWDKFKLALTTGVATTVAALLIDLPTRSSFELAPEDYFALPAGSMGMTLFVLLFSIPIWFVASMVRKREAKSRMIHQELAVMSVDASIEVESLQDTVRSDAQGSVVRTNA